MDRDNQEKRISPLPIISPLQSKQLDEEKVRIAKPAHKAEETIE